MTSVFSSIVRPARSQRSSTNTSASTNTTTPVCEHVHDTVEPNLVELNASLLTLTELFPDIEPEVFRELLSSFSEESRLQLVTEAMLKQGGRWIRGRYRMPAQQEEQRETSHKYKYRSVDSKKDTRGSPLALADTFRTRPYRDASKEALYHEFKGLSHSTIKAVLAEYNWSYTQARATLLVLSSKSWRSSITNFLMRRKPPSARDHPFVLWTEQRAERPRTPLLLKTKSKELDQELHETLIVPELDKQRSEQVARDFRLAVEWNEKEAEEADELYDCECCFTASTLECMSTCDSQGHYICFRCIRHSINAALYDQGWARSIDTRQCTLRCIAPITDGAEDCSGCVSLSFVNRALLEVDDGDDMIRLLNERFVSDALLKSQLPLIRCPFCSYAEIDSLALPDADLFANLKLKRRPLLLASVPFFLELLCFGVFRLALQGLLVILSSAALLNQLLPKSFPFSTPLKSGLKRIHLKRRGLRFQCQSPTCHRQSCLSCSAPWHDPHACYSSQLQSLRLTLERATTDAVKRTCPNCNLSFVKSEGCNKMVCACGYSMCYICREGLVAQGYQHFCQHFRPNPGMQCGECDKCELYRVEDEEAVIKRAKDAAERDWWEKQGTTTEKTLKRGMGKELDAFGGDHKSKISWFLGSWDAWVEKILDAVVE